jgi:filamentous hemagglutinin family protein
MSKQPTRNGKRTLGAPREKRIALPGLTPLACALRSLWLPVGVFLGAQAGEVLANPQGGQVVGGVGTISAAGHTTTIQQQTHNLAIDWQSYNVGQQELVRYNQPSTNSAAMNRIFDGNPSQILGQIQANGQVYLLNPNGVYFGPSARLDVGSLVAGGMQGNVADFMAGKLQLQTQPGTSGAVVNQGQIHAAPGGTVALVGKSVENSGTIVANAGRVNLVAGDRVAVDFDGDGMMRFAIGAPLQDNPGGKQAAVSNTGTIQADGGQVVMTAAAAQGVYSQVVNNAGVVKAGRIDNQGGVIQLVGLGPDASVVNTGTLDASAVGAGNGGTVRISGAQVTTSGQIRADAAHGAGGTVAIQAQGTAQVSGDAVVSAQGVTGGNIAVQGAQVAIQDHAIVNASGTAQGGTVTVQATDTATVAGHAQILATASAGPGGSVTIQGKEVNLQDNAVVDVSGTTQGGTVTVQSTDTTMVTGQSAIHATASQGPGGAVVLLGDKVGLTDRVRVDASGATHGGEVLVGGDLHGANASVHNAQYTYVGPGVWIEADATARGDGGKVVIWANDVTRYYGNITARGGPLAGLLGGGNGGFAEVSGKQVLDFQGTVDLTAALGGHVGTLLLDPKNITISTGTTTSGISFPSNELFANDSGLSVTINNGTLGTALTSADVILQADNDIQFSANVSWNSSKNLTVQAGRSVIIDNNVQITATDTSGSSSDISITANDTGATAANRVAGAGGIAMGTGSLISVANSGFIHLAVSTGVGGLEAGAITVGGLTTNGGDITVTQGGATVGVGILVNGAVNAGGGAMLLTTTNTSNTSQLISVLAGGSLTNSGGNITLTTNNAIGDTINVAGAITTASGDTTQMTAGGDISVGGTITGGGGVLFTTGGNVTATNTGNAVGTLAASLTGAGKSMAFTDSTSFAVDTVGGVNGIATTGGAVGLTTTGAGSTLTLTKDINTGTGANVTLVADDMSIGANIKAPTQTVTLAPYAANRPVDIGKNTAGSLGLTSGELGKITAGTLVIGSATAGAINVSAAVTSPANIMHLLSGSTVGDGGGSTGITATNLAISSVGAVNFTGSKNAVGTLSGAVTGAGNGFLFDNNNSLTVGTVDGVAGIATNAGAVNVALATGKTLTLANAIDTTVIGGVTGMAPAGANVTLQADLMTLSGQTVNAGTGGTIFLAPTKAGTKVDVGSTNPNGGLWIKDTDVTAMKAGLIDIGSTAGTSATTTAGAISITSAIAAPAALELDSTSTVTDSQGTGAIGSITGGLGLAIQAGGNVSFTNAGNAVGAIAARVGAGSFLFNAAKGIIVDRVGYVTGVNTGVGGTTGGAITITANDDIAVYQPIGVAGSTAAVVLDAGNSVSLYNGTPYTNSAAYISGGVLTKAGAATLTAAGSVTTQNGAITLYANDPGLIPTAVGTAVLSMAPAATLTSNGGAISLTMGAGNTVKWPTQASSTLTLGNLTSGGGAITVTQNGPTAGSNIVVNGTVNSGSGALTLSATNATGSITTNLGSNLNSTGTFASPIYLNTVGGDITVNGSITGGANAALLISSGGTVAANNAGNAIGTLAANLTTAGKALSLVNSVGFAVDTIGALSGITTKGGAVTLKTMGADALLTLTQGIDTGTTGAAVTLQSDQMAINNTVKAPGAGNWVLLRPNSLTQTIDLGGPDAVGTLGLTATEIGNITTGGTLVIGGPNGGSINVTAPINLLETLHLYTGPSGTISGAGAITGGLGLAISSGGAVNITGVNAVGTLAAAVGAGGFTFNNSGNLAVGTVDLVYSPVSGITTNGGAVDVSVTPNVVTGKTLSLGAGIDTTNANGTPGGANVILQADLMTLAGQAINAGTGGTIFLAPTTAGTAVDVGILANAGALNITAADLSAMTAKFIDIGTGVGGITTAGNISITSLVTPPTALELDTLSTVTDSSVAPPFAGYITGGHGLAIQAVGSVSLTNPLYDVGTIAAAVTGAGSTFTFNAAKGIAVGQVGNVIGVTTGVAGSVAGGNILIQAHDDLTVNQPIAVLFGAAGGVTLAAGNSVILAPTGGITTQGGAIAITADDPTLLPTNLAAVASLNLGGPLTSNGGAITLTMGGGANTSSDITLGSFTTGGGNLTVNQNGKSPGSSILAGATSVINVGTGSLTLNLDNALNTTGKVLIGNGLGTGATVQAAILAGQTQGGSFSVDLSAATTVGTSTSTTAVDAMGALLLVPLNGIVTGGGAVTLNVAGGDLGLAQQVNAGAGAVTLIDSGNIVQTGGAIAAGGLSVTAKAAALTSTTNAVSGALVASIAAGDFLFTDSKAINIGKIGALSGVTASGKVVLTALGANGITENYGGTGGGITATGGLAVTAGAAVDLTTATNTVSGNLAVDMSKAAAGSGFTFKDSAAALLTVGTVTGSVTGMVSGVSKTVTQTVSGINDAGGAVTLDVAGGLGQGLSAAPNESILASTLSVTAAGAVALLNPLNHVGTLAGYVSGNGNGFSYLDASSVTVGTLAGISVPTITGVTTGNGGTTGGAIAITANDDITVNSPVTVQTAGATGSVTLDAGNSVTLAAAGAVTTQGGAIAITADDPLRTPTAAAVAVLSMDPAAALTSNGGAITLTMGAGNQTSSSLTINNLDSRVFPGGTGGGDITVNQFGKTNGSAIAVNGTVNAGAGNLTLNITNAANTTGTITTAAASNLNSTATTTLLAPGGITANGSITGGGNLVFKSGGQVWADNTANDIGKLAAQLSGTGQFLYFRDSKGYAVDTVTSPVGSVGTVNGIATTNGDVYLYAGLGGNNNTLSINQPLLAGTGNVYLNNNTNLGGAIQETATGRIQGATLTVLASGGATLTSANNAVTTLAGSVTGGDFLYTNNGALTVGSTPWLSGIVDTAGNVVLKVTGALTQSTATAFQAITATGLSVTATGGAALTNTSNNVSGNLAANVSGGDFLFKNQGGITIGQVGNLQGVTDSAGNVVLTAGALGAAGKGITENAGVVGVAGANGASGVNGIYTTSGLGLVATGAIDLSGVAGGIANTVSGNLAVDLSAASGAAFTFKDSAAALLTVGTVTGTVGAVTQTVQGLNDPGGTVLLTLGGPLAQSAALAAEAVTAGSLSVTTTAAGDVTLNNAWNSVATVAASVKSGGFFFTDNTALSVGAVAGGQTGITTADKNVGILVTGAAANPLTIANNINAGTGIVALQDAATGAGSNISETGGVITAGSLSVRTSAGSATLTGANSVGTLAGTVTGGGLQFTNSKALTIGPVAAVGPVGAANTGITTTLGNIVINLGGMTLSLADNTAVANSGNITVGGGGVDLVTNVGGITLLGGGGGTNTISGTGIGNAVKLSSITGNGATLAVSSGGDIDFMGTTINLGGGALTGTLTQAGYSLNLAPVTSVTLNAAGSVFNGAGGSLLGPGYKVNGTAVANYWWVNATDTGVVNLLTNSKVCAICVAFNNFGQVVGSAKGADTIDFSGYTAGALTVNIGASTGVGYGWQGNAGLGNPPAAFPTGYALSSSYTQGFDGMGAFVGSAGGTTMALLGGPYIWTLDQIASGVAKGNIKGYNAGATTLAFAGVNNIVGTTDVALAAQGDTIVSNNLPGAVTWAVTGLDMGTITMVGGGGAISFSNIVGLTGGTGADTFQMTTATSSLFGLVVPSNGGLLTGGSVDGGGGTNAVQYAVASTTTLSGSGATVGYNATSTTGLLQGFKNITNLDNTAGQGTLVGYDPGVGNIAWTLTGAGGGTFVDSTAGGKTLTFTGQQSLTGAGGTDNFNVTLAGSLAGKVDGGGGANTLSYNGYTAGPASVTVSGTGTAVGFRALPTDVLAGSATALAGGFDNITNLVGTGNAADKLTMGYTTTTQWTVNTPNAGTMQDSGAGRTLTFSAIESLTGGLGNDTFTLANGGGPSGSLTGMVDGGGGGLDTLDYGSYTATTATVTLTNLGTGNIGFQGAGTALATGGGALGFDRITAVNLNAATVNTLVGLNQATQWTVNALNAGNMLVGTSTLLFTNVANLTGGTAADSFLIDNNGTTSGSLTGQIDGGAGAANSLSYASYTTAPVTVTLAGTVGSGFMGTDKNNTTSAAILKSGFTNIGTLTGTGAAGDKLVGTNAAAIWTVNAPNAGIMVSTNTLTFSQFANLTGGSNTDSFFIDNNGVTTGQLSGRVDGGGGANTLDYSQYTLGAVSVAATATGSAGAGSGFAGTGTNVGTSGGTGFDNIGTVVGSSNAGDTLTGPNLATVWNITAANTGTMVAGGNTLNFSAIESLVGTASADTLDYSGYTGASSVVLTGAGTADGFTGTASGLSGTFDNMNAYTGHTGTDSTNSLTNYNTPGNWAVTGADAGTLTAGGWQMTFTALGNLVGTGSADTLDYSGYTGASAAVLTGLGTVDGFKGTAAGLAGGFDNMNVYTGHTGTNSTNSLQTYNTATGFAVTGTDAGTLTAGGRQMTFTVAGLLKGNGGVDTLNYSGYTGASAVVLTGTGTVDGLAGTVSGLSGGFDNMNAYAGHTGTAATNTLTNYNTAGNFAVTSTDAGTLTAGGRTMTFAVVGGLVGNAATDTLDFSGYTGASSVSLTGPGTLDGLMGTALGLSGTFDNMNAYTGHTGTNSTNTLTNYNTAGNWAVTGADAGTLTAGGRAMTFAAVGHLMGTASADTFTLGAGGSVSGAIEGQGGVNTIDWSAQAGNLALTLSGPGGTVGMSGTASQGVGGGFKDITQVTGTGTGTNQITGANLGTTWSVTGANSGTYVDNGSGKSLAFGKIGTLLGGTAGNVFKMVAGGSLTGSVAGGAGTDTISWASYGKVGAVALTGVNSGLGYSGTGAGIAGGFASIDGMTGYGSGGATGDSLAALNLPNTWNVTGKDTGKLTSSGQSFSFTNVSNLRGGSSTDNFILANGALVSGSIDGQAGVDVLNLSAYTTPRAVTLTGPGTVDGLQGNEAAVAYFNNINSVLVNPAGNSTLSGANLGATWNIVGTNNTANVIYGTAAPVTLTGFQTLNGGTGIDNFVFANGATWAGTLNGGGGTALNTLDLSATSAANHWVVYGTNSGTVNATAFTGMNNLLGGSGGDSFNVTATGSLTGTGGGNLTAGSGHDVVTLSGNVGGNVSLGAGNDTLSIQGAGVLGGIADGGPGANSLAVLGGNYATIDALSKFIHFSDFTGSGSQTLLVNPSSLSGAINDQGSGTIGGVTYSGIQNLTTTQGLVITHMGGGALAAATFTTPITFAGNVALQGGSDIWQYTAGVPLSTTVTGTGALQVIPQIAGSNVTVGGDLILPNTTAYKGNLVIGGLITTSPLVPIKVYAGNLDVNTAIVNGGIVTLMGSNVTLSANVTAGQRGASGSPIFIVAVGNTPLLGGTQGPGTITATQEVTLSGSGATLIAAESIQSAANITLALGGGYIQVAQGSSDTPAFSSLSDVTGRGIDSFNGQLGDAKGLLDPMNIMLGADSLAAALANALPVKSQVIQISNSASILTGLQNIRFIDSSLFEEDLQIFSVIGTGVALTLDQCEEIEGCAPTVTLEQLMALMDGIQKRMTEIARRREAGDMDPALAERLLTAYGTQLKTFTDYRGQLAAYLDRQNEPEEDFASFDDEVGGGGGGVAAGKGGPMASGDEFASQMKNEFGTEIGEIEGFDTEELLADDLDILQEDVGDLVEEGEETVEGFLDVPFDADLAKVGEESASEKKAQLSPAAAEEDALLDKILENKDKDKDEDPKGPGKGPDKEKVPTPTAAGKGATSAQRERPTARAGGVA